MRQTKRTNAKIPAAPNVPEPEDDDPVPENIDEFRLELARKIARFIGNQKQYWRGCKEPICRRQRACQAPRIRCSNAPASKPVTPKQEARMKAKLYRLVHEQIAKREGERLQGAKR